jgi:hypothetical protein
MVTNRPADFLVDVRLDQLGSPISMITGDKPCHCDIVQETRYDDLVVEPPFSRQPCALEKVVGYHWHEAVPEEVCQPWLGRHLRQSRIITHHQVAAVSECRENVVLRQMRVLAHSANRRS